MDDAQQQLRDALEANGISLDWSDWLDTQGLGWEVATKAGIVGDEAIGDEEEGERSR